MHQDKPLVISVEECARLLSIGRNSAYALVAEGKLPHLRLGKRIVIPKAALERMLAEAGTIAQPAPIS